MAKKHFSLPDSVLDWLEAEAQSRGMRRSQFLTYLLMGLMDEKANKARSPK